MNERIITNLLIERFAYFLQEQEKSKTTIDKYVRDLKKLKNFTGSENLTKLMVISYKDHLLKKSKLYKTSSINSFIVAANQFFEYTGWTDLKIKTFKLQKKIFLSETNELSKKEYKKLLETARQLGKHKIGAIIETICATGIRVSELSAISVQAVRKGYSVVYNKGKERQIIFPRSLQVKLLQYARINNIRTGIIFRTSRHNPIDRTWIWREMKKLCQQAGVDKAKVFPHNLRHLFARTYYSMFKDIVKLSNILGHSNTNTTMIYLRDPYTIHNNQMEQLNLTLQPPIST